MKIRAGKAKDYSSRKYYKAPFFAKPGEIGNLFGYSNFDDGEEIESDFAIIDLETSGLSAAYVDALKAYALSRGPCLTLPYATLKEKLAERLTNPRVPSAHWYGKTDVNWWICP